MSARERILVMSHGHPDLIRGGGEISAHQCYKTYVEHRDVEKAWFLAAADLGRGATGRLRRHNPNEYLWEQSLADPFRMMAANLYEVTGYFAELIRNLRPTVIHTHHYFRFGLEYLKVIKDLDPSIQLVMTLHEYIAICPNEGLMQNPGTGELCVTGRYDLHQKCAPEHTQDELFLRFHRFQNYFAFVDHFIAPSDFLRERYIEWGIPAEKITTIRNGQPDRKVLPPRSLGQSNAYNRFAFFGQINRHKGLEVLLNALNHLGHARRKSLILEVHGANLDYQPKDFRKRISKLAKPLADKGTLVWMGSYSPKELPDRMANIDWVCVPSVWYENAPLVIQEAFGHGRPVLATDLGGMKEAVRHGKDGILLPRGNAPAWGEVMHELSRDTETWNAFRKNLPRPVSLKESIDQHLDLFKQHATVSA